MQNWELYSNRGSLYSLEWSLPKVTIGTLSEITTTLSNLEMQSTLLKIQNHNKKNSSTTRIHYESTIPINKLPLTSILALLILKNHN